MLSVLENMFIQEGGKQRKQQSYTGGRRRKGKGTRRTGKGKGRGKRTRKH